MPRKRKSVSKPTQHHIGEVTEKNDTMDIEPLLKQKKVAKGKLTRLVNAVNNLSEKQCTISEIEVFEHDAQALETEVDSLTNSILTSCSDEHYDELETEMHDLLSKLDTLKIALKSELKKLNTNTSVSVMLQNHESQSNVNSQNANVSDDQNCLKLPRIELPVFTSNFLDWISFRDLFLASVGNNKVIVKNCST